MPADSKVLDRIEKLLQLATNNPNEAEAAAAALKAAQLLKEHGLKVGAASPITDFEALFNSVYGGANSEAGRAARAAVRKAGGQAAPPR